MPTYRTHSASETEKLAGLFAEKLRKEKPQSKALIICLEGDLGSGKTTFTSYLLRKLSPGTKVTSPTFVLWRRMPLKNCPFEYAIHLDAYRLKGEDIGPLGLEQEYEKGENIIIVEWPERIREHLPKKHLNIFFYHGRTPEERIIKTPINLDLSKKGLAGNK